MKKMRIKGSIIVAVIMMMFGLTSSPVHAYYSYGSSKDSNTCNHGSCTSKKMTGSNYCSAHTCYQSGCYKEVNKRNDRCAAHKAQYYEKLGISTSSHPITTCNVSGCSKSRATGSSYCATHTCSNGTCKKKTLTGSSYCSSHTCSYPGCYKKVNYHSYSSKKNDEYNASDYDDYEDFYEDYYDDFDGIDDAEDYWEEHH